MRARKTPFVSQCAALMIGFLAAIHSIIALDLLFRFFPPTEEFMALRGIAPWAKELWVVLCLVGGAAAVLLYRRAWLGFLASVFFCACLYVASLQLWGSVKGGFWLAVAATVLAGIGAVRARGEPVAASPARAPWGPANPFLFCAIFTGLSGLNCVVFFVAKLGFGAPLVKSDAVVAMFGVAMGWMTTHFIRRYRELRRQARADQA